MEIQKVHASTFFGILPLIASFGKFLTKMAILFVSGSATCYFPAELQGDFQMQFSGRAGAVGAPPGSTSPEMGAELGSGGRSGGGPGSGSASAHPPQVRYSTITIFSETISTWGRCERRIGHNVILKDK